MSRAAAISKIVKDLTKNASIATSAGKAAKTVKSSLKKYDDTRHGFMRRSGHDYYSGFAGRSVDSAISYIGLGAAAHFTAKSTLESFGDQMSGLEKFMIGGVSTGVKAFAGARAITHLGRAGMAKFGGGSELRGLKADLKQKRIKQAKKRSDNIRADIHRQRTPTTGASGIREEKKLEGLRRTNERQIKSLEAGKEQGILLNKGRPAGAGARTNAEKVRNVLAVENAKKFSTMGVLSKALALPGGMIGAMAGKGTLFGKKDATMKFIGSSMTFGIGGGLLAGTGLGIMSNMNRNLGPVKGPRGRQQRSFSNLNYNATLHSHGMNSNALR